MQLTCQSLYSNTWPEAARHGSCRSADPPLVASSLVFPVEWASHSAECLVLKDTYFSYNIAPECEPTRCFIWCSTEERAICSKIGASVVCGGYVESQYYDLQQCLLMDVERWSLTICSVLFLKGGQSLVFAWDPSPLWDVRPLYWFLQCTFGVLFTPFSDFNRVKHHML